MKSGMVPFPEGRLNEFEDHALNVAIAHAQGQVVVNFGTPISWFAMSRQQALNIAALLTKHAGALKQ